MSLILRAVFLALAYYLIPLFLGAITYKTGGSGIYPLIIPILGSIALILILSRFGKEKLLKWLPFIFLIVSFQLEQGSFANYTLIGLAQCLFFFNAIRPWNG